MERGEPGGGTSRLIWFAVVDGARVLLSPRRSCPRAAGILAPPMPLRRSCPRAARILTPHVQRSEKAHLAPKNAPTKAQNRPFGTPPPSPFNPVSFSLTPSPSFLIPIFLFEEFVAEIQQVEFFLGTRESGVEPT